MKIGFEIEKETVNYRAYTHVLDKHI